MNLKVWGCWQGRAMPMGSAWLIANVSAATGGALRIVVKSVIPVISFSAFGGIAQLVERLVRKDFLRFCDSLGLW